MWRRIAGAFALLWAAAGLLWAQAIVLPHPLLPPRFLVGALSRVPPTTTAPRFLAMLASEYGLLLTGYALAGILLAVLVRRLGFRTGSIVAAAACTVALGVSLVPVARAWRTASSEGVSLSEPFAASPSESSRSPQSVTYARPGGERLKLDVWRPPDGGARKRQAVVLVHGGAWVRGHRSQMPLWDIWLSNRGYVVFDIDYRLSPPPRWRQAPGDVECAVGWVRENAVRYGVDPRRVALMGRSAGGNLVLLSAYAGGSDRLKPGCDVRNTGVAAVVAFYPPTDLTRFSLSGMKSFLGGTPGTVPARYRFASPVDHVDPSDPPTFLVYGTGDRIVPPEQSRLLAEKLREAGVPHRVVELPGAKHSFDVAWGSWNSQITRTALKRFLKRYLGRP